MLTIQPKIKAGGSFVDCAAKINRGGTFAELYNVTIELNTPDNTIWVLGTGQSNFKGSDNTGDHVNNPNVLVLNASTGTLDPWYSDLDPPPHTTPGAGPVGSGPTVDQDSMGRYFCDLLQRATGKRVVMVHIALGGVPIDDFLSPSGPLYLTLREEIESVYGYLVPRIDLHVHHQGESSTTDFPTKLVAFRTDLEALAKYPANCPLIIGELFRKSQHDTRNAQLNSFASADPDVEIASSLGLEDKGDDVHFTSFALLTMAERMLAFVPARVATIEANAAGSAPSGAVSDLAGVFTDSVVLTWTDLADASVTDYVIERESPIGGGFSVVGGVEAGAGTFTDATVAGDTEYNYRLRPQNKTGYGSYSNTESGTTTTSIPYIEEQGFEGIGAPAGWSTYNGATLNFDSTSSPIDDAKSLGMQAENDEAQFNFPAAQTDVWVYCKMKTSALVANSSSCIAIRSAARAPLAVVQIDNGVITLYAGGSASAASALALTPNTVHHFWLRYVSGGTCELYISTDGVKPASDSAAGCRLVKIGDVGSAERLYLKGFENGGGTYYDRVLILDSEIGDNP